MTGGPGLPRARAVLESGAADGTFPGAVLWVARRGEVVEHACAGVRRLEPERQALSLTTLFDIASLTKPMATASIAMRLHARGALDLDAPGATWLPGMDGRITLRHLLQHTSGLPAWRALYKAVEPGPDAAEKIAALVAAHPLEAEPGTRCLYSDLGFIALGRALERAAGRDLRALAQDEVFAPLGLADTAFGPIDAEAREVASTERCAWRKHVLAGEAHDENCAAMGGVAGHAGLFSTVADVGRFGEAVRRAVEGDARAAAWLPAEVARRFVWERPEGVPGATYALGWDSPTPGASSAGRHVSPRAAGHLAFTGCSLWIDFDRAAVCALLTNRVHPTRRNEQIKRFRPRLHDAVFEELAPIASSS